jgi:excisionase family DNA binding protein
MSKLGGQNGPTTTKGVQNKVSKRMVTLDQAAEELQCSKRHLRRLIASGQLKAYRLGRNSHLIRIDLNDLNGALQPITPSGAR